MARKTQQGEDRYLTSGDGRKNFDSDIINEAEEDFENCSD